MSLALTGIQKYTARQLVNNCINKANNIKLSVQLIDK